MDSSGASAPLPKVKQEPPTLVGATIVKLEVTEPGISENSVNGGGGSSSEGSVSVDKVSGESGDGDTEVKVQRKWARPGKRPVESQGRLPSLRNLVPNRKMGHPPGTGKLLVQAAMDRLAGETVGENFTPHVAIIPAGEDIFGKILPVVVQTSPRALYILSAVGAVAIADICPAGYCCGGVLRHEGYFWLVSLSGTFTLCEAGRTKGRLTVTLADADANVFGGVVVGSLIAAVPTQIVLGSFMQRKKTLLKTQSAESSTAVDGLGRFRVPPTTFQLPDTEEKFIATPLSPHPKSPSGNANQDVDSASLQNSDQNTSELSDQASYATLPDN